ncbi:MAG TPA: hypothetical protein VGS19_13070 [Streptosporangiaceae bacterium]|nr:hypothetical protein [Streptosporangiaceae bacterium]
MSTIEHRLQAASRAAGATVAPGSAPPLRLPDPPAISSWAAGGRRPAPTWVTPLTAAAAVTTVLCGVLAFSHLLGGARPHAPVATAAAISSVPAYYVALTGNLASPRRDAVVRMTSTGAQVRTVVPPSPYARFDWVSAAGDDRSFVLAAQRWWSNSAWRHGLSAEAWNMQAPLAFFHLRIIPPAPHARRSLGIHVLLSALSIGTALPAGSVGGLALSPDGRKLALARTGSCCTQKSQAGIEVVTLLNRRERQWRWQGPATSGPDRAGNPRPTCQSLSWAADSRTLAFQVALPAGGAQVRLLDTDAPGTSLSTSRLAVAFPTSTWQVRLASSRTVITPDGSKVIVTTMSRVTTTGSYGTPNAGSAVTEFSADTGRVDFSMGSTRAAAWKEVLWSDSSGNRLLVIAGTGAGNAGEMGVLSGNVFTPLPHTQQPSDQMAW